jgi:hypothetical protein
MFVWGAIFLFCQTDEKKWYANHKQPEFQIFGLYDDEYITTIFRLFVCGRQSSSSNKYIKQTHENERGG